MDTFGKSGLEGLATQDQIIIYLEGNMSTRNAKDMTPDEWRKAREAIRQQHAHAQQRQREEAALKSIERKYPKPEGTAQ